MTGSRKRNSVLVTGASGFIGRALVPKLTSDWTVYAASRAGQVVGDAIPVTLDVTDPASVENLPQRLDAVVHLAAAIEAPDFDTHLNVNVLGTERIVRYAQGAGARIIVHGSTGEVYGSSPQVLTEISSYAPQDPYGLSKAQADLIIDTFDGDISRVSLIYCAPYAVGTPNPISMIVERVIAEQEIPVSGGMYPRYNPLHLDDAVEMTNRALGLDGLHRLNISGKEITTFAGIALIAGLAVDRTPRFRLIDLKEAIPYYRSDIIMDGSKAYEVLSYEPRIPLRQGISDIARRLAGIPTPI